MKKMSWGKLSLAVLCVSLLLNSCSKGSDGAAGATGPAGPAGPAGPTGAVGSANVIYSAWTDVAMAINSNQTAFIGTITAAKIVDSILQKGDVKVYINLNTAAAPAVSPLPYSESYFVTDTTTLVYHLYPVFQLGKITLVGNADFSTTGTGTAKTGQYRYIIIPGGVASGRSATIDWNDYAEVKKYLDLKD